MKRKHVNECSLRSRTNAGFMKGMIYILSALFLFLLGHCSVIDFTPACRFILYVLFLLSCCLVDLLM